MSTLGTSMQSSQTPPPVSQATTTAVASASAKDAGPPGDDYEEIREQVSHTAQSIILSAKMGFFNQNQSLMKSHTKSSLFLHIDANLYVSCSF